MKKFIQITVFLTLLSFSAWGQDTLYDKAGKPAYIKHKEVIQPPVQYVNVDNVDKNIVYTGTWVNGPTTAPGFYPTDKPTIAYSNLAGNTATLLFTGTYLEVFCEKKVGHGSGAFQVDNQAPVTIPLWVAGPVGSTSVFKVDLPEGQHTFKLTVSGSGNVVFDYVKINGVAVSPVPPIPPANEIIVTPGQNLESIIESATSGKTVSITAGAYTANIIDVPAGVNIKGAGKSLVTINFTGTHPQPLNGNNGDNYKVGIFQLKSSSKVNGDQSISGLTVKGNNLATVGIMIRNRDNIKVFDVKVQETAFVGIWFDGVYGNSEIYNSNLYNSSWCSTGWASGEVAVFNTNVYIHNNEFVTDRPDKGYGVKALFDKGSLAVRIENNLFNMSKNSNWNNGQSPNFGIELHDFYPAGFTIKDNVSNLPFSLVAKYPTQSGRAIVTGNTINWSFTMAIELAMSNITIEKNKISGCAMFTANYKANGKSVDVIVNDNDYVSSGANPSWGGTFLIGPDGAVMSVTNNKITKGNYTLVKYMGVTGGVTVDGSNVIQ